MKIKSMIAGGISTLLVAAGLAVMPVMAASAHTPFITGSCEGVVLTATNYEGDKANTWSVTIGGETQSGTFGGSYNNTFAVPQEGATTTWSAAIAAENGTYSLSNSGTVGPCGEPPVVVPEKPLPLVEYGNWEVVSSDCVALTTLESRWVKTTDWILVDNVWVKTEVVETSENQTREATNEECPPVVPPTTYTPTCTSVTGDYVIVGDGVISVAGEWESKSITVPFSGTLADIGTVLDIQATPLQYVGLHIDTAEGTIVFEEEPSYGGNLWSNSTFEGVNPGMGYAAFGSISEFIKYNGDVAVTGIRLLYTHPEASSTTVDNFTVGCTLYTFEPAVVEEPPTELPPTTPYTELAFTGSSTDVTPFLGGAAGLMLLGTVAVLVGSRRRKNEVQL